ncbi:uncharacterized protein LOC120354093 [Nilaparvata lugens]|uniref:uncharacterized protein LOC120354093 n=1 Tax=Nilaparvata lugens TaxID=108931 RepID=UPI00193D088D|nr:uncharacterized protein LOC120354093 [Nilaparvata lugens]
MGNTASMRQFVNLLRYDKPSNSLPIFLSIFLTIIGFVTVITAALNEKDVDTSLEAIKDIVSVSIGSFVCIIEQSLYPERTLNLIQVIEDDFVVDREELRERGDGLWTEIGELYQRKREDMREKFQYLYWAIVFIFCGYFSKHFLNRVLGIEVQSKERWPTPFLSENEKEKRRLMYEERDSTRSRSGGDLRGDMRRIVRCHQMINRNLKICTDCSAFAITGALAVIINDSCSNAFFMLKNNNLKKTVSYAFIFIVENLLLLFLCQNGQRIFNQNDILRRYLAELPWTDKPRWFRQTVHMMMTRANFDTEMRPYGIFVLNYVSFKDIMKFTFSVGNVLYTKKLRSQSQL